MNRKQRLIHAITGDVHNELGMLPTKPLVEIYEYKRVLIEHHCGIIAYGSREIIVRISFGSISVCGRNLMVRFLSKEKLVITGCVNGITLHRENRHGCD